MDLSISESFGTAAQEIDCSLCFRKITYFDRLSDGSFVCLSCSYKEGFPLSENCILNAKDLDINDVEIRKNLVSISQIDIDRADKQMCTTQIVIPEDLFKPLRQLMLLHNSSLNAEIAAAIGWYTSVCNMSGKRNLPFGEIDSIQADSPLELSEILLADDPWIK